MKIITHITSLPDKLYAYSEKMAQSKNGLRALALISLAESIVFPIPPDPLLIALVFHKPKNWKQYAGVAVSGSIIGGIIGYFIGFVLFESIGDWILDTFHLQEEFDSLGEKYSENGALTILTAALTPIPYKVITLSAGFFSINFLTFILTSIVGRGLRFLGVSAIARYLGEKHKEKVEDYLSVLSWSLLLIAILAFIFIL